MLIGKNISKSFGDVDVLKKVNIEVKKGKIVSIFGKSGAGKSTLLYILSSLDQPDTGDVFISGSNLNILVIFVYNCGCSGFRLSRFIKQLQCIRRDSWKE